MMTEKTLGKYQILELLGEGGMGLVYKAYDPLMRRTVAIKVLLERAFHSPEIKKRFYREAQSAGKLTHENITIIHDLGETDGKPYIVMEYLPGTDLRSKLEQKQELEFPTKLHYIRQICKGLDYSHSKNIVHRDIKPENIRICDDGKVKIMDFGIARHVTNTMTQTGAVMGTPHYMSPEQIKGQHVDHRSDIFSFGVLFYELMANKLPFPGDSVPTVSYKIVNEEPEPIAGAGTQIAPAVVQVIERCLQKDAGDRYQSFSEIIKDLDDVLQFLGKSNVETEFISRQPARTVTLPSDPAETELTPPSETEPPKKAGSSTKTRVAITGFVVLLLAVIAYWQLTPILTTKTGYVALNILPWAEVTRITNAANEEVDLGEEKVVTPCRLPLPEGKYTVYLQNPSLKQTLELEIDVQPNVTQEVKQKMPGFDYSQVIAELQ